MGTTWGAQQPLPCRPGGREGLVVGWEAVVWVPRRSRGMCPLAASCLTPLLCLGRAGHTWRSPGLTTPPVLRETTAPNTASHRTVPSSLLPTGSVAAGMWCCHRVRRRGGAQRGWEVGGPGAPGLSLLCCLAPGPAPSPVLGVAGQILTSAPPGHGPARGRGPVCSRGTQPSRDRPHCRPRRSGGGTRSGGGDGASAFTASDSGPALPLP